MAGAEEGAVELERAIGKARALGRDSARLERQLARVRQGMRHFRLAHPGLGEEGAEKRESEEVIEGEDLKERRPALEAEEANGDAGRGSERQGPGVVKEGEEVRGATGGPVAMEEEGAGTAPAIDRGESQEAVPAGGREVTDEGNGGNAAENDGAERAAAETEGIEKPEEATPGSAPQRETGTTETGPATAAAEPVTAVWMARMERTIEEMVREEMSRGETARAEMERNDEERLAELEARVRRVEERARMNREAG